jgi:septum formation protein
MTKKVILASGSEARKKLLENIKLDFEIVKSDYEEFMDPELPAEELAVKLALGKAQDVATHSENAVIVAADSFVILEGKYLGKPHSEEEARSMLKNISGKKQQFVTGMAVIDTETGETFTDYELSTIWISEISDAEIEDYIATNEPFSKAGGYAIQEIGSVFIEKVEGSYTGIVGLPINKLYKILRKLGVRVF